MLSLMLPTQVDQYDQRERQTAGGPTQRGVWRQTEDAEWEEVGLGTAVCAHWPLYRLCQHGSEQRQRHGSALQQNVSMFTVVLNLIHLRIDEIYNEIGHVSCYYLFYNSSF